MKGRMGEGDKGRKGGMKDKSKKIKVSIIK